MHSPAAFRFCLFALSLMAPFATQAEVRIFTSRDGRTVEAEVAGVRKDVVQLKLPGRVADVRIATLSDDDQLYIKQWQEEDVKRKPPAVNVTVTKKTQSRPSKGDKPKNLPPRNVLVSNEFSLVGHVLVIRNLSGRPLTNLSISVSSEVETTTSGGRNGGSSDYSQPYHHDTQIDNLETNKETTIECKPVELSTTVSYESFADPADRTAKIKVATKAQSRLKAAHIKIETEGRVIWDK